MNETITFLDLGIGLTFSFMCLIILPRVSRRIKW